MDLLSHLFLPLTGVYVLFNKRLSRRWWLAPLLAPFGALPDVDKFLTVPDLLHSLLTLVPLCAIILAVEYWWCDELNLAPIVVALIGSHLLLDIIDGGPVALLSPIITAGIGLRYPAQTVFSSGLVGLSIEGSLVAPQPGSPDPTNRTYGLIRGAGVASMLLFGFIYVTDQLGWRQ